jgi:diguanylate cyclase (GGDEF)-like protein
MTLIIADLDNLKPVNDTFGHQAGDAILRAVSAGLKAWRQASTTCWRLGGDEFVLALPNVDAARAIECAEELKSVVAAMIVPMDNTLVRPSISVGVASCPEDGSTAAELIGVADSRMYEEKARRVEAKKLQLVS